ncbi:hypothetical protein P22_0049 [Propionispora sp. 2/2-37]|uniref:3D domain-containing protein n=1 Tax=Propionispora sp. 2/2-37 TaxID=1677858 RepID=UPI0006BB923D|nr:3D domain-containing protein [Propionispora sp. 2/2-37]CUH93987.1 hypothetical protein P22_0049 [Propionispora sp. 2/2-37]
MNRLIATFFLAAFITILSPAIPRVYASSLNNQIYEAIIANSNNSDLQTLLAIQQLLQQDKKQDAQALVKKALVERASKLAAENGLIGGSNAQAWQNALQEQVVQHVEKRLEPYQQEVTLISRLLTQSGLLQPLAVRDNDALTGAPEQYQKVLEMTATAYAPGALDNGKWDTKTYMGGTVHKGVAAVDPRVIPMGSKLWVEGYGEAIAEDQGSAIKGNRIDLAFNDRQEALDYGIQNRKVYILD